MSITSLDGQKLIAVRGTWKKLEVSVGEECFSLSPGEIIRGILEIAEFNIEKLFALAESLQKACEDSLRYFSERDGVEFEWFSKAVHRDICELFPKPFGQLFTLLPAQGPFLNVTRYINQKCYSESEWESAFQFTGLPEKIAKWRKSSDEYSVTTLCWLTWIEALMRGPAIDSYWSDVMQYGNPLKIFDIISEYSRNLRALCVEIMKLKRDLPVLIGVVDSDPVALKYVESDVFSWTSRGQALWPEEEKEIFGSVTVKGAPAVAITAMSTLIRYELQLCHQHDMIFKRCEYCEGVFATHNSKKKYCNYPNLKHEGKPCKEIAAQKVYGEKLESDPIKKEYKGNKNKYEQWKRRTTDDKEIEKNVHMKNLRTEIIFKFGEDVWHLTLKKVKEEISAIYEQWKKCAESKIREFEAGLISEKDCMVGVKAPSVSKRSPTLALLLDSECYIDGNYLEDLGIIKKK